LKRMKFIFAPDSFKGTLTSKEVSQILECAAKKVLNSPQCVSIEMADGGEGTIDAIASMIRCKKIDVNVANPLGDIVHAKYLIDEKGGAIIEMAQASGLTLLAENKRNPLETSTYGTGQIILDAVKKGCKTITIAIGGSATNDCGMGCMRALGVKFFDKGGNLLQGVGRDLQKVEKIDTSGLISDLSNVNFKILSDVNNPLCGENGATKVFAKQKGATENMICQLENGMQRYKRCLMETFGKDPDKLVGSGAAGGLATALMLFLNGKIQSGARAILELSRFDKLICDVDCVITGEGRLDGQSCQGKAISIIGEYCKRRNIPVYALVGCKGDGWEKILNCGVTKVFAIKDEYKNITDILCNPKFTCYATAVKMFEAISHE